MNFYKDFVCLLIFLRLLTFALSVRAQSKPLVASRSLFRSVYTFGDSFVDPGNNNYLQTPAKANFPPYGKDFVNHVATGRFSNGGLLPDFLSFFFGYFNYQHPYLDPRLNLNEVVTGVSFASSTSGYDPLTANLTNALNMSTQLEYFKQYKAKLQNKVGKKEADRRIGRALFYVSTGAGDITFSYFGDGSTGGTRKENYTIPEYQLFIMQRIEEFIKGLSDQGARKIAVTGLPPLGCIPVAITRFPRQPTTDSGRSCIDILNSIARDYNILLQNQLKDIQNKLSNSGTHITYIDFEKPLLDIIKNPNRYGFTEVSKGCCGTGLDEVGPTCNKTSAVCADASKYVFWDAAHPSERTYFITFLQNLAAVLRIVRG
ncbi:Triacylglycerol lipase [Bertholletia excelsa]